MQPGNVISHTALCARERKNLQAGVHFRIALGDRLVLGAAVELPIADS